MNDGLLLALVDELEDKFAQLMYLTEERSVRRELLKNMLQYTVPVIRQVRRSDERLHFIRIESIRDDEEFLEIADVTGTYMTKSTQLNRKAGTPPVWRRQI